MNNANLANALREAATARGFSFRTADDDRTAAPAPSLPAALLSHPLLRSVEGRKHGRAEYDVVLRLADDAAKLPEKGRNALRQRLENELLDIFAEVSDAPFVIAVDNLTVAQKPFSALGLGEVSLTAEARVLTFF